MHDETDRRLIVATQGGLPRVPRPYEDLAARLGISSEEVRARLQRMLATGAIRRIGAVPNHYALGYTANGMSVWDVDDDHCDALGVAVGKLDFVTHCYRRPRHLPDWPYNLFAMVHAHTREEVESRLVVIRELLGEHCRAADVLYSNGILKKTGLRLAE
ncbi:MAG: AsnC family transcriptional regulator [Ignavibacteria bacterium]